MAFSILLLVDERIVQVEAAPVKFEEIDRGASVARIERSEIRVEARR
jgi:hypothetical protein